jgi:hypothetical protein
MPEINQLSALDSLSAGDQIPVYAASQGDARKVSVTTLTEYMQAQVTSQDGMQTQYAAPTSTGFSISVTPTVAGGDVWLRITPTAGFAAGTIVLPALSACVDRQEILVSCNQAVTTLTITPNGSTVEGGPTTLAANAFFRLRYEAVFHVWVRVG